MTELNFSIRWQTFGRNIRKGHVGEPYGGRFASQKYAYPYYITGNAKPPLRWFATHTNDAAREVIGKFETLTEAKDACQKHWESQPECPKNRKFKAVSKVVEKQEKAGMEHAAERIPCINTLGPTWDRTETDLLEEGLQDMITSAEYDKVEEAIWMLANVAKAIGERRNLGGLHFVTAPKDDPYVLIGSALAKLVRVNK